MTHEDYMRQAIDLARECIPDGDVPVGCVVVSPDGEIIGRGRNRREQANRATAHAEVEAINEACAGLLAAGALYPVRHPGALPYVRRGYHQFPHF